jgi:tetratricopeptide (TPR) repeat protein
MSLLLTAVPVHSDQKTYEELNHQGLLHFHRAYYAAMPQSNTQVIAKEYQLAEKTFQEAIRLSPQRPEAYANLGQTYFVQEKFNASASMYEKALALAPDRKDLYLKLASALERSGDNERAIQVLTQLQARETDPDARQGLEVFIQAFKNKAGTYPPKNKKDKTNEGAIKPMPHD